MQGKILILDDNPMMCAFMERLFADSNYEVTVCDAEATSVPLFEQGYRPDLIILDQQLGETDGLSFLELLDSKREIWGERPVLMVSGSKQASLRIEAFKRGALDFITKPFHPEELKLRVARLMAKETVNG